MPEKVLTNDLDNCLINFDRKVLVTNLLDEYGGLLEDIAKTVNEFLLAEEAKGKKFEKTFLLRGTQSDSENEVITIVPEEKLQQRERQLKNTHSLLYSAETAGGSKSLPTEFVPLKHISVKLDSLKVKEANASIPNGATPMVVGIKEEKPAKKTGALGAMFKKQETAAAKKSPQKSPPKKSEPENKGGALGAMFKKQETAAASKKSEPEKKSNTLGAMFKKQETTSKKKSPEATQVVKSTPDKSTNASKKGLGSFLTKTDDTEKFKPSVIKPPTPKKVDEFFQKEEAAVNVSVNLFDESASSDDEEALDALKREILTDDEEEKPSTSNKRRRIIDSDDEDSGPEVKVERKEIKEEVIEIEDDKTKASATFLDDDGFVVTVKAKNKKPAAVNKPTSAAAKVKKESPKSPAKKEAPSKTPVAKKKQGNIMNFFTKK